MKLSEESRRTLASLEGDIEQVEELLGDWATVEGIPEHWLPFMLNLHSAAVAYRNALRMVEALVDSRAQQP